MKSALGSHSLPEVSGAQFGRNIDTYSKEIFDGKTAFALKVRSQRRAVVLSPSEYDDLVATSIKYEQLLQERNAKAIEAARSEFDDLYARITSEKSAVAMRNMINVTTEDLANHYRPGRTETN